MQISAEIIALVDRLAAEHARATGSAVPGYYRRYYLDLQRHLEALYPVGCALGISEDDRVLEVGSGMGTRCILGCALWGARFTGLEPCPDTYAPLRAVKDEFQRINAHLPYEAVDAPGEDSGLPAAHFDSVLSFEVLEHVRNPGVVVSEMHRVLKPGGALFLSTCNYSSFYEGHYRAPWLPFLGKRSARVWARLLGRNPGFVEEINFLTRRALVRYLRTAGFREIAFDPVVPSVAPPTLEITGLPAAGAADDGGQPPTLHRLIERPRIHRLLARLGLEYKVYVRARK